MTKEEFAKIQKDSDLISHTVGKTIEEITPLVARYLLFFLGKPIDVNWQNETDNYCPFKVTENGLKIFLWHFSCGETDNVEYFIPYEVFEPNPDWDKLKAHAEKANEKQLNYYREQRRLEAERQKNERRKTYLQLKNEFKDEGI